MSRQSSWFIRFKCRAYLDLFCRACFVSHHASGVHLSARSRVRLSLGRFRDAIGATFLVYSFLADLFFLVACPSLTCNWVQPFFSYKSILDMQLGAHPSCPNYKSILNMHMCPPNFLS
mgnify:CR=1 FL=1